MDYYPVEAHRPATMECILQSAVRRNVPADVLLAIGQHEAGVEGSKIKNTNGTYDLGRTGINTVHLSLFPKFGISEETAAYYLKFDGCFSYDMAAYLLQGHLRNCKVDFWTCVGYYHSRPFLPKNPTDKDVDRYQRSVANNARYISLVRPLAKQWSLYLSNNYSVKGYSN